MGSKNLTKRWFRCLSGLTVLMALVSTGCQVDIAGQTLPSPWYLTDDIQFFRVSVRIEADVNVGYLRNKHSGSLPILTRRLRVFA